MMKSSFQYNICTIKKKKAPLKAKMKRVFKVLPSTRKCVSTTVITIE